MIIYDYQQGSDEWKSIRIGLITSSNILSICGTSLGRKTYCLEKVCEKLTGKSDEIFITRDMQRGIDFETIARDLYSFIRNIEVIEIGIATINDFVGSSPDGLVGYDGLLEIKCPKAKGHLSVVVGGINDIKKAYIYQMQHQMLVMDRKWCDFVSYNEDFENPIHIIRVMRDENIISNIKECTDLAIQEIQKNIDIYYNDKFN
tara:strand:- start:916 stop:1524 length:609 start_codon:yes stop_codon:yes gene_type:complete